MKDTHDVFLTGRHAAAFLLSGIVKEFDDPFEASLPSDANYMAFREGCIDFSSVPLANTAPYISKADALAVAELVGVGLPLEVAVANDETRRCSRRLHCRTHPASAPQGYYFQAADELYCAAPELTLLVCARQLADVELLVLACLFVSIFTHDLSSQQKLAPRRKLTNVVRIERFIDQCGTSCTKRPPALQRLQRLMPYVVEDAASPKEIECALRFGLARDVGGCGFGMPLMNVPIKITGTTRVRYPDLYWSKEGVAVDYDSKQEHSNSDALENDALHANDLAAAHVQRYVLTSGQLNSMLLFNRVANQLAYDMDGAEKIPNNRSLHATQNCLAQDIRNAFKKFGY